MTNFSLILDVSKDFRPSSTICRYKNNVNFLKFFIDHWILCTSCSLICWFVTFMCLEQCGFVRFGLADYWVCGYMHHEWVLEQCHYTWVSILRLRIASQSSLTSKEICCGNARNRNHKVPKIQPQDCRILCYKVDPIQHSPESLSTILNNFHYPSLLTFSFKCSVTNDFNLVIKDGLDSLIVACCA